MCVGHRDLRSLRSLKTALKCYSGRRLPDPCGHKALRKRYVFDTCARELPSYSTAMVQPIVHPMVLSGDWSSSWVRAIDVFGSMPNTLFHKYLKLMLADTNDYQPYVCYGKLPKKLWQFIECGECGRKPWECMAMGSWVGTMPDCHLACVYCSTYRAIEDFVKSDTKWFDMLQLGGQVRHCLTSYQNCRQMAASTPLYAPMWSVAICLCALLHT